MKRLKKELSWVLVLTLVVSSITLGFGQLKADAVANVGTGLVAVHINIGENDCSNGNRGTDSSFRLQFIDAAGNVVSATPDNAIEGRPEQSSWGDPLENNATTTFAANAGQGGNVQFIAASLGTMTVNNTINRVQLVNTYWEDDWAFNNVVVKYSYDGGSNWVDLSSGGWSSGSSGAVGTWNVSWFASNYKTLSFNANGGSGGASYEAIPGQTITAPANPTRTGYTFTGWSGLPARMPNANATYNASWTQNIYTVSFNSTGGGTASPATKDIAYGNQYGTLATVSKEGYTLNGWYTASSGGTKIETTTAMTTAANHSLYAQWTPITYTVAYNANGGTGTTANSTHTYDVALALTTNGFTRTGYTFAGWATYAGGLWHTATGRAFPTWPIRKGQRLPCTPGGLRLAIPSPTMSMPQAAGDRPQECRVPTTFSILFRNFP